MVCFPYFLSNFRLSESEGFRLFSMYERLILWQKKSDPNFDSRLKILILLKEQMSELLAVRVTTDWCDPLGSLCLGPLQPNEVMFQVNIDKQLHQWYFFVLGLVHME